MPVTFLRTPADYLGIQEPPAQPLFQQTRALADPAVQNQLNYMDQLTRLRQQRPLARTQAIQNEYNTIFENANRLRMQQEAAKQAEQAVSALAGLTPEADNYTEQRRQIQRQFPSAMLDTRVQSIMDDNDRVFNTRQTAAAKRSQDEMSLAADLAGAGMTDLAEAQRIARQGPLAVSAAKYQLGKSGGGSGENSRLKLIKSGLDTLAETLKNTPEDIETPDGQFIPNPVRKSLLDKYSQYSAEYQTELDNALFPKANGVGSAAPPPTVAPSAAQVKPAPPPVEQTIDLDTVPLNEIETTIKKTKEESENIAAKEQVWNKAQMDLEKALEKAFPGNYEGTNYAKLRRVAKAIVDGERIPDPNPKPAYDESGSNQTISVTEDVLSKIGKPLKGEALVEPGTGRKRLFGLVGDQRVPYDELLKVWAKNYLDRANVTAQPQLPPISQEAAQTKSNLLKSVGLNGNG